MAYTKLIELQRPTLEDGTLIQGLPGLGLVGKIAVDYIVNELKLPKIAEYYSSHFLLPDSRSGVEIDLDGLLKLPHYEFYLLTGGKDIVFLAGDTQPVSWGQYETGNDVLDYFESIGGKTVIAVCATAIRKREKEIYFIADNKDSAKDLTNLGFKPSRGGAITGACGMLPGVAKLRGMNAFILMGGTTSTLADPEAARLVINALIKVLQIDVKLDNLDLMITEVRKKKRTALNLQKQARDTRKRPEQPGYYV